MNDEPVAESRFGKAGSFEVALCALKKGFAITRSGWNGKGMWLMRQVPDEHSKMSLPYIYMKTADGHLVPWLASQTDLLANDWAVVNRGDFNDQQQSEGQ